MTNKRLFRLRRALLAALLEYSSYQDLDTVMLHPVVIGENASPEELRVEWRNLTEWGMIEPLTGYQGAVCRLTAATRRTMEETGNAPRDSRLYGFEVQ